MVTSHPESASFNFALADAAERTFRENGVSLRHTRLYQDGFAIAPGRSDFEAFPETLPLRLMDAQRHSEAHGGFVLSLRQEQEALVWADLLMLQFPVWWGSYPAALKGWIERVLAYGFAYGREKTLPPKAVVLSVTTGGADTDRERAEYVERLDSLADDVFGYMGWRVHPHLIAHGPARATDEARRDMLREHRSGVRALVKERTI